MVLAKIRQVGQWNRIEGPVTNLHSYSRLHKGAQKYIVEKKTSSTNGSGKTGYPYIQFETRSLALIVCKTKKST
jgi:hypothetical protein